ncbi:hypothetical protein DRJ17_03625 [Candidatus Woesearchaeota archaeon]|nr:MAG: hypothetical protein DRJ17_03625 [Candidatus Woesearchaeota archaeon]
MSKVTVFEVKNLVKQFGQKIVLDGVSFKVEKGDIFGVIGMSGSGKTTLLNTMIGFLDPDEGEVFYRPIRALDNTTESLKLVHKNKHEVETVFGFASQDPSFYLQLTIIENLRHFGSLYGMSKKILNSNIEKLLKLTGLEDAKKTIARSLSGGMQKRLDIACALVHSPQVLILDEPTADLDPILRKQMWELIRQINERGTTILLSSHFLSELEGLCTKIAILHNGKILEVGSPNELKYLYSKNEEINLETAPGRYKKIIEKLKKSSDVKIDKVIDKGHKIIIYTPKSEQALHRILHIMEQMNEKLLDVRVNKPSLNEIFESLVEND